jgi:multiple sugar transport system ATP-binding protein
MAEISLVNLSKHFKDVEVIQGLDLVINEGEFFTFVGPSGCGKSTLLNIIAGLEQPTGGSIRFDGSPVERFSPKERDVAMVFQSYALYPHLSVYENLAFPLRMRKKGKEEIDGEVCRVAGLLGLDGLLSRKPKQLSGGQRQRVALGRAIIRRPRVFLMDEPLSNLDALLRVEMRAELKKLHRELKITTVYVTHDQAEALSLSDRIAVLYQGAIQQCGTPHEVYLEPANRYVAGFIGSPPMNFVPCRYAEGKNRLDCGGIGLKKRVRLSENGRAVMGIRPEFVRVSGRKTKGSIRVQVTMVEPAGSFNWVDFYLGEVEMKGTGAFNEDLGAGSPAFMSFPESKALYFDPDTGKRL